MKILDAIHGGYVFGRRVRVLCDWLVDFLPPDATVLDVGCGDGLLDKLVMERRPDVRIEGLDVLVRERTHIPVKRFGGGSFPCDDDSYLVVMFVDVLHHVNDPRALLREGGRVAQKAIVMKDHILNGFLAEQTLRVMDYVGNARYSVSLPYNYWSREQWHRAFRELDLSVERWQENLKLYPPLADWIFGRSLHFIARLAVKADAPHPDASRRGNSP